MFVSADFLGIQFGVDDKIAKFFVDRQPPVNNLYWKDKLLYLRSQPGWLFIPLIVDLLFKLGIGREQLLSEAFIGLMENIGHISAEEELKIITKEEALKKLIQLVEGNCKSELFYNQLVDYMRGLPHNSFAKLATPYKALHRGDAFLFAICSLEFNQDLQEKIVQYWFALISSLLLLDDAEDIEIDKLANDENAFIESGLNKKGVEDLKQMIMKHIQMISLLNRTMATKLDKSYKDLLNKPHIQQLLNSQ